MYRKILVCYDGSMNGDRAVDEALKIASEDSSITVLHVIPKQKVTIEVEGEKKSTQDFFVDKLNDYSESHANIEGLVLSGPVASVILSHLAKEDYDFVVVGARGLGGLSKRLFGSISSRILEEARVPVLLVK